MNKKGLSIVLALLMTGCSLNGVSENNDSSIIESSILSVESSEESSSTSEILSEEISSTVNNDEVSEVSSSVEEESSSITIDLNKANEIYNNIATYIKDVSKEDSSTSSFHIKKAYQPTDDKTTLQSITALMKLTANMYLDEDFIVTEQMVVFEMAGMKTAFSNEFNVQDNKVITNIIIPYEESNSALLMNMEVDYNFNLNLIEGFIIRQIHWADELCNLHFKYEDGVFYEFSPKDNIEDEDEEGKKIIEESFAIKDELKNKENQKIVLDADYTQEYMDAMEFAFE